MKKIELSKRKFIVFYQALNNMYVEYDSNHIFKYYISLNLNKHNDLYKSLKELELELGNKSDVLKEFEELKKEFFKEIKTTFELEKLEKSDEYQNFLKPYLKNIEEYDVKSNNIGSFLSNKEIYEFETIPYQYIPKEINHIYFEFLYKLIDEPVETFYNKFGV
jgi:phenylalanyl-tRNA synthetase alpha subunit